MKERAETVPDGERIADLLWEVNRLLRDRLLEHADATELPPFRGPFRLLARVIAEPGVTVNELARRIQVPQSRVSVVASELERDGLIRREPDPGDRRLHHLHVTPEGRSRMEGWRRAYRRFFREQIRPLPTARTSELEAGLMALRDALEGGRT